MKAETITNIYIGIWDNNHDPKESINEIFIRRKQFDDYEGCALNLRWGELRGDEKPNVGEIKYNNNCPPGYPGDIVEMVLEFTQDDKCQLNYIINGTDYGTAFRFLECSTYRAAVSIS